MWKKSFILQLCSLAIAMLLSSSAGHHAGETPVHIKISAHILSSDNLGNIYAVSGNTIRIYNASGKLTAEFTMRQYDRFDDLDPADPFKILAFNQITGETIRLDNKLATQGQPASLYTLGISDPVQVGNSYDGGIWVYDKTRHELLRINNHGNIDVQSGNLAGVIPENAPVTMIREHDFMLYLASPNAGLLVFDRYANLIRSIPEKNITTFQVVAGKVLFLNSNKLQVLDTRTRTTVSHQLPDNPNPLSARVEGNTLIIRYKQKISIYPFNSSL